MHILSVKGVIGHQNGNTTQSFVAGLFPEIVQDASHTLLFEVTGDPFKEDLTPLVRMLLRFGAIQKKHLPEEDSSAWNTASLRSNQAVLEVMTPFDDQK